MPAELLLVEDSSFKRDRVLDLLRAALPDLTVDGVESFNAGARALDAGTFKVVVLDLSLPTYDRDSPQGGGRFRKLGGRELARKLVRRAIATNIIFLTQYDAFSDKSKSISLSELVSELKSECGGRYFGTIRYDSGKSTWKSELLAAVRRALNESSGSR